MKNTFNFNFTNVNKFAAKKYLRKEKQVVNLLKNKNDGWYRKFEKNNKYRK